MGLGVNFLNEAFANAWHLTRQRLHGEEKLTLRASISSLLRKNRWIPAVATVACGAVFLVAVSGAHLFWIVGTAVVLAFASYVCGYMARALKIIEYPSLLNLPRRQYAQVWDALATTPELARAAATGEADEKAVRRSAETPLKNLMELAGVRPEDDILEFGCGVARIGLELAPRCRSWTGADLSANMLAIAAQRLEGVSNVRLVKLQQVGLDQLENNSFDLVYSTNMLAHLDEMDRWRYVKDAFRVLRAGGRLCIDNLDLESDEVWADFAREAERGQVLERVPYQPTPSTSVEFLTYASRAGFVNEQVHKRPPLIILTALKPTNALTL